MNKFYLAERRKIPTPETKKPPEGGFAKRVGVLLLFSGGFHGGSPLGLGRESFSFEIARPALAFFGLVELFAHISVFTSALYYDFVLPL